MTDEHALMRESERGRLAKAIEENPVWIDAWSSYHDNLLEWMGSVDATDVESLEAKRLLNLLRQLRADLSLVMETGLLADTALERIRNGRPNT